MAPSCSFLLAESTSTGMPSRDQRRVPEGIDLEALAAFYRLGNTHHTDLLEFNTFTGSDIRPVLYMPPNPQATDDRRLGYVEELGDVQTITISSHRPAIPARVLGNASPAGYGRSVRTFAGTMIFNRVDQDAFTGGWGKSELERPDLFPFFIDAIPPFHIILHAQNEMGLQASAAMLEITLSDYGTAYTIEDLVPDVSMSYVCRYIHPFMDRDNWVHHLRDAVSKLENAGGRAASDLAPDDTINDVLDMSLSEDVSA